jgi:hypothetical protein
MPHLIRDVAEEVLRDFLLSKVFRLETGEERSSSTKLAGRLRLPSKFGCASLLFVEVCRTSPILLVGVLKPLRLITVLRSC